VANVKSAAKQIRVSKKRNIRNRAHRSAMRTAIRRLDEALAGGDAPAIGAATRQATRTMSKMASKGVIHKRKASRLHSRLRRRANRALAAKG